MLKIRKFRFLVVVLFLLFSPYLALAQEQEPISKQVTSITSLAVFATAILIGILVLVALTRQEMTEQHKTELLWGITTPVILVSLFVAASTVFLDVVSETKGPVHWQAELKIINCGQEVDLYDPPGLANRLGSALYHEHNDSQIHVEGTVQDIRNLTLEKFFTNLGGQVSAGEMIIPTNDGFIQMANGQRCQGGDSQYEGRIAGLQAFVYRTQGRKMIQETLADWPNYVLSPQTEAPPGDCIVIDFTPASRGQTKHICDAHLKALRQGLYIADNFDY